MTDFNQDYDEAKLLARLQAGDAAACAACIEQHAAGVYRLALRLMRNEADAEDVMQETFMSAFQAIESFEGRSSLKTWLYRIAYNAAMSRLRRPFPVTFSVENSLETAEEGYTLPRQLFDWCCLPEQAFHTTEVRSFLERAVAELPDTLRGAFVLRELEGLSTEETAESLAVSTDVVKTRLRRARLWLRERLSEHFTEQVTLQEEEPRYGQ